MEEAALMLPHRRVRVLSTGHLASRTCAPPAPSRVLAMAGVTPIPLLLLDGPMANGGRTKPVFRTFFPAAARLPRETKNAPRRFSAPLRPADSCGPRPPWPVLRQQDDGSPATANRRQKDGTGTWVCDEERDRWIRRYARDDEPQKAHRLPNARKKRTSIQTSGSTPRTVGRSAAGTGSAGTAATHTCR